MKNKAEDTSAWSLIYTKNKKGPGLELCVTPCLIEQSSY